MVLNACQTVYINISQNSVFCFCGDLDTPESYVKLYNILWIISTPRAFIHSSGRSWKKVYYIGMLGQLTGQTCLANCQIKVFEKNMNKIDTFLYIVVSRIFLISFPYIYVYQYSASLITGVHHWFVCVQTWITFFVL